MIRDAIEKIIELSGPHTVTNQMGTLMYSDKKLYPVDQNRTAKPIYTKTLTSIVDYVRDYAEKDGYSKGNLMLHVVDHETVRLIDCMNSDSERECLIEACAKTPQFEFGRFTVAESFTIAVQALVKKDAQSDREIVLKFAGTTKSGTVTQYKDDGITQKATIKQGVASMAEAVVPSPCRLRPYRTFLEIEQPMSEFIFRMREGANGVECALFSADGGAWKIDAMDSIRKFFEKELEGTGVTIIM